MNFTFKLVSKKGKAPFGQMLDYMKNMNSFVRVHSITLHTFVYICHYVKENKNSPKDSTNTNGCHCVWKKSDCPVLAKHIFFTRNMQSSQFLRYCLIKIF